MAVAYSASLAPTSVTFLAAGEAETVAFNAGSGSDRVLIVQVTWRDRGNDISGITYNGASLTSLSSVVTNGVLSSRFFGMANPASGSNNIVVTMGAGSNSSVAQISAWAGEGADQTTPFDTAVTANGSASTANIVSSATVTGASGDMGVFFHATSNGSQNLSATASGYTERQDAFNGSGFSTEFGDQDNATTGSATWSNTAIAVSWITLAVNINAAAAAGGNRRRRLLLAA